MTTAPTTAVGHDPSAPHARRFPRVITPAEIDVLPRMRFSEGIDQTIFLSRERDDARHFRQGYCWIAADAATYAWFPANFDEYQFCEEGLVRVNVEDAAGQRIVLEAAPGEHIYLPGGFHYELEATGVPTRFLFSSGPSARRGISVTEYSAQLIALRGK